MYFVPAARARRTHSAAAEIGRVELPVEVVVDLDGNLALVRALGIGVGARPTDLGFFEADGAPVDEEAKAPLGPPAEALGIRARTRASASGGDVSRTACR